MWFFLLRFHSLDSFVPAMNLTCTFSLTWLPFHPSGSVVGELLRMKNSLCWVFLSFFSFIIFINSISRPERVIKRCCCFWSALFAAHQFFSSSLARWIASHESFTDKKNWTESMRDVLAMPTDIIIIKSYELPTHTSTAAPAVGRSYSSSSSSSSSIGVCCLVPCWKIFAGSWDGVHIMSFGWRWNEAMYANHNGNLCVALSPNSFHCLSLSAFFFLFCVFASPRHRRRHRRV